MNSKYFKNIFIKKIREKLIDFWYKKILVTGINFIFYNDIKKNLDIAKFLVCLINSKDYLDMHHFALNH